MFTTRLQRYTIRGMTKKEAADLFGGKQVYLAEALGLTKGAISLWPDDLTAEQTDRVLGAALRLRRTIPKELKQRGTGVSKRLGRGAVAA